MTPAPDATLEPERGATEDSPEDLPQEDRFDAEAHGALIGALREHRGLGAARANPPALDGAAAAASVPAVPWWALLLWVVAAYFTLDVGLELPGLLVSAIIIFAPTVLLTVRLAGRVKRLQEAEPRTALGVVESVTVRREPKSTVCIRGEDGTARTYGVGRTLAERLSPGVAGVLHLRGDALIDLRPLDA